MQVLRELRLLLRGPGFRKLFAVRLTSQLGDGIFEVGLATLFFFSPEKASTATGVAVAFAVLLLPFTLVGPWAGVLLDRWQRRQVLYVGNLVRFALTVAIAATMLAVGVGPAVYVLALLELSVNRFLLSALSASLPRVVDSELLLTANSLTPTLGAVAAGAGGGVGLVLGLVLTPGRTKDAAVLTLAGLIFAAASVLATRMDRALLGPEAGDRSDLASVRDSLTSLAVGLLDGARHLRRRGTPAWALAVMATHRFLFGVVFIASILIARNRLADPADAAAGLRSFGAVLVAAALGFVLAAVVTPVLNPRLGPHRWVVWCLLIAAASQLVLTVTISRWALLMGALALGFAAEGAKIAVDTIVQRDTDDAYRGRAFALYDVLYNGAFVGASALAAWVLPDTGYSRPVFAALTLTYVATATAYHRTPRAATQ